MNLNSFIRKKSIDSISGEGDSMGSGMKRVLGVRDLTLFGIAAIVGAGIFLSLIHI